MNQLMAIMQANDRSSARRERTNVRNYREPAVQPHLFAQWGVWYCQNGQVSASGPNKEEAFKRWSRVWALDMKRPRVGHEPQPTALTPEARELFQRLIDKDPQLKAYVERTGLEHHHRIGSPK